MAILVKHESGWVVSHAEFIKNIYKTTRDDNKIKSYHLNPSLFDIRIPFVKKRNNINELVGDVVTVRSAYEHLYKSYSSFISSLPDPNRDNNFQAKNLANSFYCQLTRHPESNFLGGNSSPETLVSKIGEEFFLIPKNSLFYCFDIKEVSKYLNNEKFDFILMDPPWWNKYIRRKRKQNSKFGYDMLYDKDLCDIPINLLLSDDGIIGVWCTSAPSHINSVLNELFPAWGIQYIAQWFWLKITKLGQPICDFGENLGKQPFERIIFGIKTNTVRRFLNPEKDKIIMSIPSAIHSHKPPLCDLLEPYLPKQPNCLELFARYLLPGWTSYGKEVLKLQHMSLYKEDPT